MKAYVQQCRGRFVLETSASSMGLRKHVLIGYFGRNTAKSAVYLLRENVLRGCVSMYFLMKKQQVELHRKGKVQNTIKHRIIKSDFRQAKYVTRGVMWLPLFSLLSHGIYPVSLSWRSQQQNRKDCSLSPQAKSVVVQLSGLVAFRNKTCV